MSKLWDSMTDEQKSRISRASYLEWNYKKHQQHGKDMWGIMGETVMYSWHRGTEAILDELEKVANGESDET